MQLAEGICQGDGWASGLGIFQVLNVSCDFNSSLPTSYSKGPTLNLRVGWWSSLSFVGAMSFILAEFALDSRVLGLGQNLENVDLFNLNDHAIPPF